ncbi:MULTISPECIES: glycosyltransferase family 2 protein [Comamonas]|uniref:glycosyltransferase family 2 protein n=1 Tax=Comamonas thiooxydans TaxID=363952 RepID=UPI002114247A|nr:glycosyltransferase family 2 protein [Comamonas thiooxydans]UUE92268.1 glycosyltransferase [Comamonas thiooxydans]
MPQKIKLSICIVTFNHEKFIYECLDSVVKQEVNFSFEVIVADDFSQDKTREIIVDFQKKYPKIIKPIFRKENIGSVHNYMDAHSKAVGEYIAHVDGDDFLLPSKLQLQVDRFDSDPSLNIVWHRMMFFNAERNIKVPHPDVKSPFIDRKFSRRDLMLYGTVGSHSSMMYRKENFSLRYKDFAALDWLIAVDVIGDGYGIVMPEVLGAYRVHAHGMSGGASANYKIRELFCNCQLEAIKRFPEFKSEIAARAFVLMLADLKSKKWFFTKSLKVLLKSMRIPRIDFIFEIINFYNFSKLPSEFKI